MLLFTKSDMAYTYRWMYRPEQHSHFPLGPDYRFFNRNEGYEVLFVINEYLVNKDLHNTKSGKKLEKMLHDHLPHRDFNHTDLFRWIDKNWDNPDFTI